jgi:BMFP domain-containing protein YqiC
MQSQNKLLDDLARVASGAFGVAAGMRGEVEGRLREQFERIIAQMDLVSREDYEVAYTMAQNAREEQEAMAERLTALESRIADLESRLETQQAGKSTAKGGRKTTKAKSAKTAGDEGSAGDDDAKE